jgi:MFS family permease
MFVSLVGTWIQSVALSWLIFQLTNSAFLLGVVGFLSSIPIFLLSLFGGVLADRMNKRSILIFTQTAFMLLAFILAVLTQFKLITPSQIMLIALLNGIIMAFDAPSRQAVVVELVGKKHLYNAIALNSVSFNSSRIIGPALAGILVSAIGMSGCFYLNAVSFLAVIVALFTIKIKSNGSNLRNSSALKDLKDTIIFMKHNRLLLGLVSLVGIVSLFGVSYAILMPIFANDILKVGVKGLGTLMSAAGLGALLGALLLARLGDFKYKGRFLISCAYIFSASLILFSMCKIYLLSLVILVFIGASSVAPVALINTILQTKVPDEFRGRVMSVFLLTFAGIMPFGNLFSGVLAAAFGVSASILIGGVICAVLFVIVNVVYPGIKDI